jgi:hypothetical protein
VKFVKWLSNDPVPFFLIGFVLWATTGHILAALAIVLWLFFVLFLGQEKSNAAYPVLWLGVGILGTLFVLAVKSHW